MLQLYLSVMDTQKHVILYKLRREQRKSDLPSKLKVYLQNRTNN